MIFKFLDLVEKYDAKGISSNMRSAIIAIGLAIACSGLSMAGFGYSLKVVDKEE